MVFIVGVSTHICQDSSTPRCHLPIRQRIDHKVALIVFCSLCRCNTFSLPITCPQYIFSLLSFYSPSRALRSISALNLVVSPIKTHGEARFSWAWNSLSIKSASSYASFRSLLKTHLFRQAFP